MINNIKEFPDLFGLSSKGKIKYWTISAIQFDNIRAKVSVTHGYADHPDSFQTNEKEIYSKNIGKKNQTTPYEQAVLEAQSAFNRKIDEQYVEDQTLLMHQVEVELPMLAHEFTKRGHNVVYPCYVQPKLNGARCLIKKLNHEMRATSRGGKEYKAIQAIKNDLMDAMNTFDILDGELYNHQLSFQEIMTAIKNETDLDINLSKIQYWVYDLAIEGLFFDERYKIISQMVADADSDSIVLVPTYLVHDEQELAERHAEFTAQGFEGTMIRNTDGVYKFKHRSVDLQKYKDFQDAEFKIIGGNEGSGLSAGQCIFICETQDGQPFGVRCIGPNAVREEQWQNLNSYINQYLTVKFQNYSDTGIPIFPVGLQIREGKFVNGQFEPDI
ncbi:hypothetical protein [uncultured Flavobacterium sp.]|uniref:ATP-dependent DNA ligase n=1 Tax=uncultured Flavobacterium sp. TaxID=165435 RepID=UPI0025971DC5|nr:hypothetical protein [uncultured Flavobacterium sp.]